MIDFSDSKIEPQKLYDGLNGNKIAIFYKEELYMLKFPKDKNTLNATINEHLSSQIFKSLGFKTQETLLGTYKGTIVVACKDFEGFDNRLINFGKIKNSAISINGSFSSTDLNETLEIIKKQEIIDPNILKDFFWKMFIADTLVANFDRHNGNWGLLRDKDAKISIAPIYDCGSSLYSKLSDDEIQAYLNKSGDFNNLMLNFSLCAATKDGKKINPSQYLKITNDKDILKSLKKIVTLIDIAKINKMIDDLSLISVVRKEFYKKTISYRAKMLENILKLSLNKERSLNL